MASASKRLNEKLAKFNHLYDEEDTSTPATSTEGEVGLPVAETIPVTNGSTAETKDNKEEPSQKEDNSNDNNNVVEPERVPVKKIMANVSVHVECGEKNSGVMAGDGNGVADGMFITELSATAKGGKTNDVSLSTRSLCGRVCLYGLVL